MNTELEKLLLLKRRAALPCVLIAAAECSPLSKTGGLADVAGALPKSLNALGFDARVITPYHRCIKEKYEKRVRHICDFYISLGWRRQYVGVEKLELNGLTVYLIDNDYYFGGKIYRGGLAEGEQYAFFQRAVAECLPYLDFSPEVLHCNDWHTAMLPFLLRTQYAGKMQGHLKTVLTIHNIAFQGKFGFDFVNDLLSIEPRWYTPYCIEHYGCVNFLKAGCVFADRVNTVSPSYADEIRTPFFGEGLQNVLISRGGNLSGIINGIDTEVFDPETDPELKFNYSSATPEVKKQNKAALFSELGLSCDADTPLVAMVTRMTSQKGFDLVSEALDGIMSLGAAFILLGTGDDVYENMMRNAQSRYPGRLCAYLSYNEPLAHRIYAGADFLLMPSAFEPCGLSQMIAMRYGALPIVHEVGGLRDTVIPYNRFTGAGNGFSFSDYTARTMLSTVRYALDTYCNSAAMQSLIHSAMTRVFSFDASAVEYGKLFLSVLDDSDCLVRHEPYSEAHRSPLGAVRCGQRVCLRLLTGDFVGSAELVTGEGVYPMHRESGLFTVSYRTPDTPQVVWYYFRLPGNVLFGDDGLGYDSVKPFQMTVYDASFETPAWASGAVMYQIFPDRYRKRGAYPENGAAYHRRLGRKIELHKSWDEPVKWQGKDGEFYYPNDFFGGTLSGIEAELPRLHKMGIGCIYLNPIFESDSNHRYNTADYLKIDPMLGTTASFMRLCGAANKLGMHIIIDGVFSHTGDDSVYFNKAGLYPTPGAYQGKDSPFYSWYDFRNFPNEYRCWWGFKSLPEVKESDPGWQDFIIKNDDSVIKTWLKNGAAGYRLDVADELPDGIIELMRSSIKAEKSDALIIGEVWEDAVTKVSYGSSRRYALGRALDSVMNYPLYKLTVSFALGKVSSGELFELLLSQKLNYPEPMYRCLMNLLGSHDTARLRTVLGSGLDGLDMNREEQHSFSLTEEQDIRGRTLQKLCAAIVFALPGMPCIYYGDEEGMQGFADPFCRAPYKAGDAEMRQYYTDLISLRNGSSALRTGDAAFAAPDADVISILRFDKDEAYLAAVNRASQEKRLELSVSAFSGAGAQALSALPQLPSLTLPPLEAAIIKIK